MFYNVTHPGMTVQQGDILVSKFTYLLTYFSSLFSIRSRDLSTSSEVLYTLGWRWVSNAAL